MKLKLITLILAGLVSQAVMASTVVERKAMREAEAKIIEAAQQTKATCGNAELAVSVSWDDFQSMIAANEQVLQDNRYQGQWVLSHTADRNMSVFEALSSICKDDADYKEVIAELSAVVIKPKPKFTDSESSFKLEGSTLLIESGHRMNRSAADFVRPIKQLF